MPADVPEGAYTSSDVCRIANVSYRQIDYWVRTRLIVPSINDPSGSGRYRMYSEGDLRKVVLLKQMMDSGFGLRKIRSVFDELGTVDLDSFVGWIVVSTEGVKIVSDEVCESDLSASLLGGKGFVWVARLGRESEGSTPETGGGS